MTSGFDPDAWGEPGRIAQLIAESTRRNWIVSVGCDDEGNWIANYVADPEP